MPDPASIAAKNILIDRDAFNPREHGHRDYHRWCGRCRRLLRRYARAQTPWWGV